ncbi:hypothetical protein YK48G_21900 [Lentilactobacillus fungorum]|uniref:MucBP domain protein n=1 Tax=Lentilactobacillus fungorum TaxID=2201250 RepID=A0ABQ3W0R9_9LACO|nr:DUF5776 domain-containing protein [Lentilactobacillus fungorum]GHP14765.1 hypothetical protein YK48G_21900 [Lentilactobacillus fungorum]
MVNHKGIDDYHGFKLMLITIMSALIMLFVGLTLTATTARGAGETNFVPGKSDFNISKTVGLQYTYQHPALNQVQGAKAWQGAKYAAAIPDDAKGIDKQTGNAYIDEWLPDYAFQYFLYLEAFDQKYSSISTFRDNFSKDEMKTLKSLTSDQSKQNAGTEESPKASVYYNALMSMQTLEGLQYATDLTTINLDPDPTVSAAVFGTAAKNGNLWDISALTNLKELTSVSMQMFSVNDIAALANKPKLQQVALAYNQIADLSPLATNKNNPNLDLTRGFSHQHILLNPVTLRTGTTTYTTPSFIIKDLQAHNLPVKPYDSDTEQSKYAALYPSTSDSQNVDPTTLNWTNFIPDPTDYYGALSSHWNDANSDFEGWIMVPYQFKAGVGNVNVNYQMLQADGNQLTLAPTTVISGTVGDPYNLGNNSETAYTLNRLLGILGYKAFTVLDGTGQYSDYLANNGKANAVGQTGTFTEALQARTIIFTQGTSKINVAYGYADPNEATKFVPFNEAGTQTPVSMEKEGQVGTALNLDDVKRDFPRYEFVGVGTIENGQLKKLANGPILFGNNDKQIVLLYQKAADATITVNYVDTNGKALTNVANSTIAGYPDDKLASTDITSLTKKIDGYTFDHYQDAKGNKLDNLADQTYAGLNGKLTVVYKKSTTPTPPNPPTPTPTPQPTPTPDSTPTAPAGNSATASNADSKPATASKANPSVIAKKGEAVYSLKKIYLYKGQTFKKAQRIVGYAKKPRVNRPMFVVTNYAHSKNGILRYVVKDVNHHSKTAGKKGYITANWQYVRPVYYRSSHRTLTVISPRGVNEYKNKNLTSKVKNYKQGTRLKVKGFVTHHLTTRYLLENGHYVTGNRKLVIASRTPQPKQIKVKKTIYRYHDTNFNKRLNPVKKGTVLKVKKWTYSHEYSLTTFGAKRYQVAGGYVTANPRFVKIIK